MKIFHLLMYFSIYINQIRDKVKLRKKVVEMKNI